MFKFIDQYKQEEVQYRTETNNDCKTRNTGKQYVMS